MVSHGRRRSRSRGALIGALLAGAATVGCGDRTPNPDAEFLVVSADSTFWVTVTGGAARIRGVPMLVARVDGRFQELYVVDDDHSYYDAVFVGHRLFARDLERGDSIELHRDTVVTRLAREYALAHPDESPLSPDEPESESLAIRATADLEILALHGPYLSYEHHTDVEVADERSADHRHGYTRGVLDVRTGKVLSVAELFGRASADSAIAEGRREWRLASDSLLAMPGLAKRRARQALAAFAFDASSFTLGDSARLPTLRFAVPGRGHDPDITPVELASRRMPVPAWWESAAPELPVSATDHEAWTRGSDTVTSTPQREAHTWALRVRLGASEARGVASLSSAVERVIWLDGRVSSSARAALRKAFAEAAEYEASGQVALAEPRAVERADALAEVAAGRVTLASGAARVHLPDHGESSVRFTKPVTLRPRIATRVVGADDAAGREHARSRVRRRDPGDARQDRGGVRHASRADALRHRIG